MLTNYFKEKDIVVILEKFPDILIKESRDVKSEVRLNGGKSIDLVIKDNTEKIYLIEVKLSPSLLAVGQLMEYRELFKKENPDKVTSGLICSLGDLGLINLPEGIEYINLCKNPTFLNKIIDILSAKLDTISTTINLPLNISLIKGYMSVSDSFALNSEEWIVGVKNFFLEKKITETNKVTFNEKMATIWHIGRNASLKRIDELISKGYLISKAGYKAEKLISINTI